MNLTPRPRPSADRPSKPSRAPWPFARYFKKLRPRLNRAGTRAMARQPGEVETLDVSASSSSSRNPLCVRPRRGCLRLPLRSPARAQRSTRTTALSLRSEERDNGAYHKEQVRFSSHSPALHFRFASHLPNFAPYCRILFKLEIKIIWGTIIPKIFSKNKNRLIIK